MAKVTEPTPARVLPLGINRRRDGSLALIDIAGRGFPPEHIFGLLWLATTGAPIARLTDGVVYVELCNARAVYDVVETTEAGVRAVLREHELFDPPPIDEARADEIAADVRARRVAVLKSLALPASLVDTLSSSQLNTLEDVAKAASARKEG